MKRLVYFSIMLIFLLGMLPALPVGAAPCPTNITVTSSADGGADTLREAISLVCPGGTITFDAGLSGAAIHLGSTLELAQNLTVDASSLALPVTVDGQSTYRVFRVAAGVTASLKHLTISNGYYTSSGAGITNFGNLTITDSTLSNNHSDYFGGGIYNQDTLTVKNTTLSGNTALYAAGAIWNNLYLTVVDSTLSGNSVTDPTSTYGGGGIFNNGVLTVINSTLSGNSASRGGGISNQMSFWIFENTIIANSTSPQDCDSWGTISTNSHNLVEDGSCAASLSGDPKLSALADNGGATWTMALQAGSPAIDAGDASICAAAPVNGMDQRGLARPQGSACDIGAFEVDTPPAVVSILRAGLSPTSASSVDFTVTFSEAVTGVNAADFILTKTGAILGESLSTVIGGPRIYTVSASTGTGAGTLRLDLVDDDSILDSTLNPLGGTGVGNGSYSSGEAYTIQQLFNIFLPFIFRWE